MDRRLFFMFCLLTAVASEAAKENPHLINIDKGKDTVTCKGDWEGDSAPGTLKDSSHKTYTCLASSCDKTSENCEQLEKVVIRVRKAEDMIELDTGALVTVLVSDVAVTALIGWAVYSICAQPRTRGGFQGSKASDKVSLIPNSGGDMYQPLNVRSDEYSTLHGPRKNRKENR